MNGRAPSRDAAARARVTGTHRIPVRGLWKRLWMYVRPHKGKLFGVVLLNAVAAVADVFSFTLLIPFLNALFGKSQILPSGGQFIGNLLQSTIGALMVPDNQMASLRNVIMVILVAVTLKNTLVWLSGHIGVHVQEFVVLYIGDSLYCPLRRCPPASRRRPWRACGTAPRGTVRTAPSSSRTARTPRTGC